jgi:hypothetical protein
MAAIRQEAVTGMHRVRPRAFAGGEQGVGTQIAVARRRRPDMDCNIGLAHMRRLGVRIAEHGDRAIAERLRRAHDATGDLAAIGDEDLAEAAHGL